MTSSKTKKMMLTALFTAITAVCAMISIPLPFTPVPINMATLAIFMAGGLLGWKYGSLSQIVYVLLGAMGAPIFSGFRGGLGHLVGPTGGYLLGYIVAAFLVGVIVDLAMKGQSGLGKLNPVKDKDPSKPDSAFKKTGNFVMTAILVSAMIVGLSSCYILGTAWFMHVTGTNLGAALVSCVVPFLIGDGLKILAATLLVLRLKPIVKI